MRGGNISTALFPAPSGLIAPVGKVNDFINNFREVAVYNRHNKFVPKHKNKKLSKF